MCYRQFLLPCYLGKREKKTFFVREKNIKLEQEESKNIK